jgi:L-threonylcarbamoyladenylate synthase
MEGGPLPEGLVSVLKEERVAIIPTDTLYALVARAFSLKAVKRVFSIKKRDEEKPLALFFGDVEEVKRYFTLSPLALKLVDRFLPGPLTLILRPISSFPDYLIGPSGGVGVRVSGHPLPRQLVKALGEPLTATSANISGVSDPLTVEAMPQKLVLNVDLVVDGGCVGGVPSTVLDLTFGRPRVLRKGAVSLEDLKGMLDG